MTDEEAWHTLADLRAHAKRFEQAVREASKAGLIVQIDFDRIDVTVVGAPPAEIIEISVNASKRIN